ncbi:hypothetical protein J7F01_33880 [Streptomyces sp. ISL-22]|uniref:hypothetical protein n=1 Tax=unclassified Streptomyces TaxID=2593676 RepID=UPI001BE96629|nr:MULTISPECIES: hypothetical protein [unclassified Streptomyces]MBT2421262.1 hypothetical protein [Streptomyces sp. ISL-24]MBT2437063.1 hypothetical protein [Streptomyces sp. ISL-22]
MSAERQIGDADLMDIAQDEARARALRKSLQRLADSPSANGALQEMAREVLSGRVGLREALRVGAYSDALGERIALARREYEQQSPEELEQQRAEAERYLEAQRAEIEQERQEAAEGSRAAQRRARHSGHDWRL